MCDWTGWCFLFCFSENQNCFSSCLSSSFTAAVSLRLLVWMNTLSMKMTHYHFNSWCDLLLFFSPWAHRDKTHQCHIWCTYSHTHTHAAKERFWILMPWKYGDQKACVLTIKHTAAFIHMRHIQRISNMNKHSKITNSNATNDLKVFQVWDLAHQKHSTIIKP